MAQQGIATISGFVGTDPQSFGKEGSVTGCSFRIACTPRYFNTVTNEWRDRSTTWITVKVFRALATNVLSSLHKGDPVVVSGALATEEWEKGGAKHSKIVMEASNVGHDLNFGTSVFQRDKRNFGESGDEDGSSGDKFAQVQTGGSVHVSSRRADHGDPWDASAVFEQAGPGSAQPAASKS